MTEEATKRADLTERVIFKAKSAKKGNLEKNNTDVQQPAPKKKKDTSSSKLSFAFDEDEEE